ncbi:hypothetical protein E4N62_46700 [Streptomyces sp. MNU76]|uniref:hypothetical protein n=1 Tax=Streptomyces sp. MNU76 TaxID=2560026 RepID=UPI001E469672|nr:hypothetical protein [Streptomyces sp. MNU76]MCC9712047.1 hypothetical protein [Streptomyces sp. MNU76]
MSEPTTTVTPAVPVPSREEIDAALRTLLRAWSPNLLPLEADAPAMEADDDEDYDPYDGCQCAGTDDDGEPLGCNCAGGCTCDSCYHQEYVRAKTCQAGPPCAGLDTRCAKATRYRVVGFRLVRDWVGAPVDLGCGHGPADECPCGDDFVYVDRGPRPRTHQTLTACSPEHAAVLIDRMRQVYAEPDDKPARLRWYIEPWAYEPHDMDLPEPLADVRAAVESARTSARMAITAHAGDGDTELWLRYLRGDLARALWHASRPLERPDEDDQADDEPSAPPQEEPSDPWAPDDEPSGGDR